MKCPIQPVPHPMHAHAALAERSSDATNLRGNLANLLSAKPPGQAEEEAN